MWNGNGDFTRVHNFSADAAAGIPLLASRQDAEWANLEQAMENVLTRDAQNFPTADLPMGGNLHSAVNSAASVNQYLRADQYLRSFPIYCAFGGTAEAMSASAQIVLASMVSGVQVLLSCPSANATTSVTLGIGGLSTATVLRADGKGPARGQVKGLHRYVYNGSNWVITDPSPVMGKIIVADGSGSAGVPVFNQVMVGTKKVNWNTVVSAEGFSLSTNGAIIVPGGVRAVRTYAFSTLQTAASATGNYHFGINESSSGTSWAHPKIGGTAYAAATVFHFNNLGTKSVEVQADYMSVQQSSRVAVFLLGTSVASVGAERTICQGGYFVVEAID